MEHLLPDTLDIFYQTPWIEHWISVWHQMENVITFQEFLATNAKEIYIVNPLLALALQFVWKGLKMTIVNMAGASAYGCAQLRC